MVADSHSILARWKNYFSQLLNVHGVSDVRQTAVHTAEPLVAEPSASEVELVIEKLKRNKSSGIDQIPRRRWGDNIRMDLQEVGCGGTDWIGLAQDRDRVEQL
jgi:hypothetical protein